jgi:diguanylate cyclase (GGDEF)-like protein
MTLSIPRIASLSAALVLLAVLCAVASGLVFWNSFYVNAQQQRAESNAHRLQAQLEAEITRYKDSARRLAARAAETGLLNDNKAIERASFAGQFALTLPQVLKLRLLPTGTHDIDADSVPELSYVCLDLLDRSEKGQKIPDAELHLSGTPSAHIDVSAPVTDPADASHVLGHVLLSLNPAMVRAPLSALQPGDGYAELRQLTPTGEALVVAGGGDASLKSGDAPVLQTIAGTNWQLAYWPAAAAWSPATLELTLGSVTALLALVLLGLSVALPQRWLTRALKQDGESFATLFNDIRTGVLMGQYPFRLQEFGELARQLHQAGEEIIQDRRSLEKKTLSDGLTGLASRPAFDAKLEQLHQQARAGLTSVLMLADIDHLEEVNTQLGPDAGDTLLKQFARQLRDALRQSDVVARLENGRFAVLYPFTDLEKIEPIAERLRARLAKEFDPGSGMPRAFSWSAGLTLVGQADRDAAIAVTRAETALKQARADGGNCNITQMPPA